MPVEANDETIRVRVREPGDFQDDSFRTIKIGEESDGIQAVIGRLEGEETTTTQAYLFDAEKWTEAEATAWVDEHKPAEKAEWTTEFINDLPDSSFLYIEPGQEKDENGKTTPRSARHFPYKDADGKVDLPHLRNAIGRIPQSNAPGLDADKRDALQARAQKILEDETGNEEKAVAALGARLVILKQADGSYRWVLFSSNAFEDREGEIVSQKALEADVARMDVAGEYGPLRWWHVGEIDVEKLKAGKGLDLGRCDFNAMHGRILVESGTFDSPVVGKAMGEHAAEMGGSIGFFHPLDDPDKEGTYKTILRFERSLLPSEAAANGLTELAAVKEVNVEDKKVEKLRSLLGTEGDSLVDALLEQAGSTEQKALEAGVRFKGEEPPPVETPAPTVTPAAGGFIDKIISLARGKKETTDPPAEPPPSGGDDTAAIPGARALLDQIRKSKVVCVLTDKSVDLSKRLDAVWQAVSDLSPKTDGDWIYTRTIYDDFAILEQGGKCFQAAYTIDADLKVVFAPVTEWAEVELSWKPVGAAVPAEEPAAGAETTTAAAAPVTPAAKAEPPPKEEMPHVGDMTLEDLTKLIKELVAGILAEGKTEEKMIGEIGAIKADVAAVKTAGDSLAAIVAELVAEQPRAMATALRASLSPETVVTKLTPEEQERVKSAPGPDPHFADKFLDALTGGKAGGQLVKGGGPAGS